MKISKGQLRRIIREELERHLLSEQSVMSAEEIKKKYPPGGPDHKAAQMVRLAAKFPAGADSQYVASVDSGSEAYNPKHVLDAAKKKGVTPDSAFESHLDTLGKSLSAAVRGMFTGHRDTGTMSKASLINYVLKNHGKFSNDEVKKVTMAWAKSN